LLHSPRATCPFRSAPIASGDLSLRHHKIKRSL
jgi:hypothetical protein